MKDLHKNQFEEKQLLKRLEKLNIEEAKNRMKYDRLSIDLIYFLKENRETTGYLSRTSPFLARPERERYRRKKDSDDERIESEIDAFSDSSQVFARKKANVRPQTANARLMVTDNAIPSTRCLSVTQVEMIKPRLKSAVAFKTSTPLPDTQHAATVETLSSRSSNSNASTADSTPKIIQNRSLIKISTGSRHLIQNNKYLRNKFSFDFLTNTRITVNMSKDYINREKARIINENKVRKSTELIDSLRKIQSAFEFKVKNFSQNAT